MDIEILDMNIRPDKSRIAFLFIRYHDLLIKCDLVLYTKLDKLWIRMPEVWFHRDQKTCFCSWPNKEISDKFQKEVLKKVFAKYDMNLDKIKEIHISACQERKLHRQNLKK